MFQVSVERPGKVTDFATHSDRIMIVNFLLLRKGQHWDEKSTFVLMGRIRN